MPRNPYFVPRNIRTIKNYKTSTAPTARAFQPAPTETSSSFPICSTQSFLKPIFFAPRQPYNLVLQLEPSLVSVPTGAPVILYSNRNLSFRSTVASPLDSHDNQTTNSHSNPASDLPSPRALAFHKIGA